MLHNKTYIFKRSNVLTVVILPKLGYYFISYDTRNLNILCTLIILFATSMCNQISIHFDIYEFRAKPIYLWNHLLLLRTMALTLFARKINSLWVCTQAFHLCLSSCIQVRKKLFWSLSASLNLCLIGVKPFFGYLTFYNVCVICYSWTTNSWTWVYT